MPCCFASHAAFAVLWRWYPIFCVDRSLLQQVAKSLNHCQHVTPVPCGPTHRLHPSVRTEVRIHAYFPDVCTCWCNFDNLHAQFVTLPELGMSAVVDAASCPWHMVIRKLAAPCVAVSHSPCGDSAAAAHYLVPSSSCYHVVPCHHDIMMVSLGVWHCRFSTRHK